MQNRIFFQHLFDTKPQDMPVIKQCPRYLQVFHNGEIGENIHALGYKNKTLSPPDTNIHCGNVLALKNHLSL